MNKYFTYQFERGKYTGYRLLIEKQNLSTFQKLTYEGFKIIYTTSEFIHYQIDTQVIRKLKLLKLGENIKRNSVEERLSQLLERSEEKTETEFKSSSFYGNYLYYYSSFNSGFENDSPQNFNNDFVEKRRRDKYHAKKYNKKI